MTHHFTVDVEEYFHVSALEPYISRSRWDSYESRVEASTRRLLDMLAKHGASATMFVLGCVAARHPSLVKDIARMGHEISSHGWGHRRVTELTPEEFRQSVRRTKHLLEDLTGAPVRGFRAPSFSIVPGREWALEILIEEGHQYDSSLYPVRRPGYGHPGAARSPCLLELRAGRIMEFPPATIRFAGVNMPAGGGGYLRLLPPVLVTGALRACSRRGVPGTFYVHPWELDSDQPRVPVPWLTKIRHYRGLAAMSGRIDRLLSTFEFTSIATTLSTPGDMLPFDGALAATCRRA